MTTWADWRDEIAKACDGSHQTIDTIEADLRAGRALALYFDGCCFLVEIQNYPGARACQVMWAAGTLEKVEASLGKLEAWARAVGCTEIIEEGALGWGRVLKRHGWKPWSMTMRKGLA